MGWWVGLGPGWRWVQPWCSPALVRGEMYPFYRQAQGKLKPYCLADGGHRAVIGLALPGSSCRVCTCRRRRWFSSSKVAMRACRAWVSAGACVGGRVAVLGWVVGLAGFFLAGNFLGLADALGGLFQALGTVFGRRFVVGHGQLGQHSGGAEREFAILDGSHQLGGGFSWMVSMCLTWAGDRRAARARASRVSRAWSGTLGTLASAAWLASVGSSAASCWVACRHSGGGGGAALGDDFALAQGQHAALKVRDAAPAQVLVNHPGARLPCS